MGSTGRLSWVKRRETIKYVKCYLLNNLLVKGGGRLENESYKLSRCISGALAIILFVVGGVTDLDSATATKEIFAVLFIIPLMWLSLIHI